MIGGDIVVSNADFVSAVMGPLNADERYWSTAFRTSPSDPSAAWGGSARVTVPDNPDQNSYISSAILKPANGTRKRAKSHFSRMPFVVLDDANVDDVSYLLETSPGNFQTGFILATPITDEATATRLQAALGAQGLVKADRHGYSAVRYVRLPNGVNTKHAPAHRCRLVKWTPSRKFSLADLATQFGLDLQRILSGETQGADLGELATNPADSTPDAKLIQDLIGGDHTHGPLVQISSRMIGQGAPTQVVTRWLQALMHASTPADIDRWNLGYADIPRTVHSAVEKFARQPDNWPELVNPFADYVAPAFPLDCLPTVFARFCEQFAAGSGFDPGGYAFALLVASSSLIDHRARLTAGPLKAPAFLWGGLVARSGGGKSPIIREALAGARKIDDAMVQESNADLQHWSAATELKAQGPKPPPPPWRQLIAGDTTVEALGKLLQDNPSGVLLAHDELTEFIGRMDAYSSSGASGKDRGTYLRAFDGGSMTINRVTKAPMVIGNFSVGILTGIQPEKLGDLFKKSGGGSDGLYQRFLMYALKPAGTVNYSARVQPEVIDAVHDLQARLHRGADDWDLFGLGYSDARLCPEAETLMEQYHQHARDLAQRTQAHRLGEHIDKFPGFMARVTFVLHHLECAETGKASDVVSVGTFRKAERIMQCMYHHSNSVYEVLDAQCGDATRLVKSACEAILSKGWDQVHYGDLTRDATAWRDADPRVAEQAIDKLITYGWLQDVTPTTGPSRRGRQSKGLFVVNPTARQKFSQQAERIKAGRAEKHAAIQALGAERSAQKEVVPI